MKKIILLIVLLFFSSCTKDKENTSSSTDSTKSKNDSIKTSDNWAKDLTMNSAKNTASEYMKTAGGSLIDMHELIVYSEYEIHGRSSINYFVKSGFDGSLLNRRFYGDFVYRKNIEGYWIMEKVDFRSGSGFSMETWTVMDAKRVVNK